MSLASQQAHGYVQAGGVSLQLVDERWLRLVVLLVGDQAPVTEAPQLAHAGSAAGSGALAVLLDRLGHHAHILTTRGASYRTGHRTEG